MKDKGNFTLTWRKQLHFYTVFSKYLHFVYVSEGKLKIINKVSRERYHWRQSATKWPKT